MWDSLHNDWDKAHFLYLVALLIVLLAGTRIRSVQEFFIKTRHMLVWVGLFVVLILGYSQKDALMAALMPFAAREGAHGSLVYTRAEDGHFYIEAKLNGVSVRFMVDTGASDIVLSPADAKRAGIAAESLHYSTLYGTANGYGRGAPVVLDEFSIGMWTQNNVRASVNQAAMDSSLLGMRYLDQLRRVTIEGDRMTLWP